MFGIVSVEAGVSVSLLGCVGLPFVVDATLLDKQIPKSRVQTVHQDK